MIKKNPTNLPTCYLILNRIFFFKSKNWVPRFSVHLCVYHVSKSNAKCIQSFMSQWLLLVMDGYCFIIYYHLCYIRAKSLYWALWILFSGWAIQRYYVREKQLMWRGCILKLWFLLLISFEELVFHKLILFFTYCTNVIVWFCAIPSWIMTGFVP